MPEKPARRAASGRSRNGSSRNNQLTLAQKTFLYCFVAMRRAGLLRAEED